MLQNKLTAPLAIAVLGLGIGLASPSHAAVVYATGTNTSNIPGLSTFTTTGAMMDGLSVTATFLGGFTETLHWADTGASSGGVAGTGWSLSLNGNSFGTNWLFTNDTSNGQLSQLVLNGLNALTVFDRTFGGEGTPDSANGWDFDCSVCASSTVNVTYDYEVSVGGNAAVGDLWQVVTVDFGQSGPRTNWTFVQDTDNDIRVTQVPEPGVVLLMALGLAAVGLSRRRSNSKA